MLCLFSRHCCITCCVFFHTLLILFLFSRLCCIICCVFFTLCLYCPCFPGSAVWWGCVFFPHSAYAVLVFQALLYYHAVSFFHTLLMLCLFSRLCCMTTLWLAPRIYRAGRRFIRYSTTCTCTTSTSTTGTSTGTAYRIKRQWGGSGTFWSGFQFSFWFYSGAWGAKKCSGNFGFTQQIHLSVRCYKNGVVYPCACTIYSSVCLYYTVYI